MKPVKVGEYEIREAKVGDIPNFFDLLQKDASKITEALIRVSVFKDGVAVGDNINDIPVKHIVKITNAVVAAAGLGDSGNE